MCDFCRIAQTVCVIVSLSDSARLEAIAVDRSRPRKHAKRAGVVPASVTGDPVQRMASHFGISCPMIWRWQQRFAEAGLDGLRRDKAREGRKATDRCGDSGPCSGVDLGRSVVSGDALDASGNG